jgi:hypothetical protein
MRWRALKVEHTMLIDDLMRLDHESIQTVSIPVADLLEDSLYYPGSGVDGTPIRHWSLGINSFVYADLSWNQDDYLKLLIKNPIRGYRLVAQREVLPQDLLVPGYVLQPPKSLDAKKYIKSLELNGAGPKTAFALWSVFERIESLTDAHGPKRFSLLHIRAEGVATYAGLYLAHQALPRTLALIRPGTGMGGNFGAFEEALIGVMKQSKRGLPKRLLWEHRSGQGQTLPQPWADLYRERVQGPWSRDDETGFCVSLYGDTNEVC